MSKNIHTQKQTYIKPNQRIGPPAHILGWSLALRELEEEVEELLVVHEGDAQLVEEHHQSLLHVRVLAAGAGGEELHEGTDDGLVHQNLLL